MRRLLVVALIMVTMTIFFASRWLLPRLVPQQSLETILLPIGKADLIRVDKSERQMQLLRDDKVIARYKISLGANPEGHKSQEGDERTPEGRYTIDWRNPKSGYFLSMHISYPNESDKELANVAGYSPGGMIMIHGQPNSYASVAPVLQGFDWTNGCIAVTNAEMKQIWNAVSNGTPIEINP